MCICISCMCGSHRHKCVCKVMGFIRILLFESIMCSGFQFPLIFLSVLLLVPFLFYPDLFPWHMYWWISIHIIYIFPPPPPHSEGSTHERRTWFVFFWIWLISLQQHTMSSVFLKMAYFLSYLWIKLHCVCTPHFLYPFTSWWTPRLVPIGYCSWCCNQPRWAIISVAFWLRLLWIYFQERLSLITSLLVGM